MSTEKPSRNEDEYFAKRDAELIKTTRSLELEKIQAEARKQHYMKCPKDGYDLSTQDMEGVQVDIATQKMTSVMEPLIIVALAVVVGFIVLAIVTPMIEMSGLT